MKCQGLLSTLKISIWNRLLREIWRNFWRYWKLCETVWNLPKFELLTTSEFHIRLKNWKQTYSNMVYGVHSERGRCGSFQCIFTSFLRRRSGRNWLNWNKYIIIFKIFHSDPKKEFHVNQSFEVWVGKCKDFGRNLGFVNETQSKLFPVILNLAYFRICLKMLLFCSSWN